MLLSHCFCPNVKWGNRCHTFFSDHILGETGCVIDHIQVLHVKKVTLTCVIQMGCAVV